MSYPSWKLNPAEQKWQVHNQELGVIVAAFAEWQYWLVGTNSPVAGFSDHTNLRYFMTSQKLTPRKFQWASYLSLFYFNILHAPGKQIPADPASPRPDYAPGPLSREDLVTLLTSSRLPNVNSYVFLHFTSLYEHYLLFTSTRGSISFN